MITILIIVGSLAIAEAIFGILLIVRMQKKEEKRISRINEYYRGNE